jgi:hypothetical protein
MSSSKTTERAKSTPAHLFTLSPKLTPELRVLFWRFTANHPRTITIREAGPSDADWNMQSVSTMQLQFSQLCRPTRNLALLPSNPTSFISDHSSEVTTFTLTMMSTAFILPHSVTWMLSMDCPTKDCLLSSILQSMQI